MPKINKVVTNVWYNKKNMIALRNVFPQAEFKYVFFYDKEKLVEETKDADVAIIMGDVPDYLLGKNTLKWIQCDHAGLNGSARPEVFARGIPVTGLAGRSAPVLAEHCIYFMFQHCYHTKELLAAQSACHWGVEGSNKWRGMYGRTVGIIGLGNNGKMLATRLKAFGMNVIGFDRFFVECPDVDTILCAENGDTMDCLLQNSDFVVLTLALTDDTYHLMNYSTFKKMKKGAFLVNMARGGVLDTNDLMKALDEGLLGGAGLDVIEEEPLDQNHPLWHYETVYITPHCTPQVPDRAALSIEIIKENAKRFEEGKPLRNLMVSSDAVTVEGAEGGWARMMNSKTPKEQMEKMDLDKYLGERGWKDPSEWL